jgi:cytochrome b561
MSSSSSSTMDRYSRAAVALHWLLAIALFVELALGWWMQGVPKSPPGIRAEWFNLHKSIGITVALLLPLRIFERSRSVRPGHDSLPAWQRRAANIGHVALYACMIVMPVSGYLGSTFTRYPVRFFGMVLPDWNRDWPAAKEWMSVLHSASVWIFVVLLGVHIAAALWHWMRRDEVCTAMGLPMRPWPRSARARRFG